MAVKKAVTTADIKSDETEPVVQLTVEDLTAPEAVAKVDAVKHVKLTSPAGFVTEVPESIVDVLIESGYSKK